MGIWTRASPFDADVEKATSEKNTSEDWGLIMEICDKVGTTSSSNAKDCLRSIIKRLGHQDLHIVLQAITLLDACVNNCGKTFHLEIASRDFETEYRKLLKGYNPPVLQKFKGLLKKWSDSEFKTDPQLNLIPSLLSKLKSEGVDFNDITDMPTKKKEHGSRAASASVSELRQKELDDLDRAIKLSLQENKQSSPRNSATASNSASSALYPNVQLGTAVPVQEVFKVRALYDFEAAEDNELTFSSGEIIHVSDSSDPNWWKGYNQRGEGLFPTNFVTKDLSVEPQNLKLTERKSVQFNDSVEVKSIERSQSPDSDEPVNINEIKIDRLKFLLHEANPEDSSTDTAEMLQLECEVNRMGPLIDMELEKIDRKHSHLTQLSYNLVEALNLYHSLMSEPPRLKQPQNTYAPLPQIMYNATSAYSGMQPHMSPFYSQAQHSVPGGVAGGIMVSGPAGSMPPHMVPPGVIPHQGQHMGLQSMPPMGPMIGMPQMMQGAMPPTSQLQSVNQHQPFTNIQQPSGGPPSGIYHTSPAGPPHSYVM